MNSIRQKQNSADMLNLLKLQRYRYTQISKLSTLNFLFAVILPIILTIVGTFNISDNYIKYINFLGLVCTFIHLCLNFKIKNSKDDTSQIQYMFDINVFNLKQSKLISNYTLTELISQAQNEKIQKQKGLEGWYSISDDLDKNDAIFSCQQQNIRWDKKLRKIYLCSLTFISLIGVFIIISIAILKNLPFNILWSYILLLIPLISYCASFIFTSISNMKDQQNLYNIFEKYKFEKPLTIKKLESLEEKIYHYRKELIKIPDWFFKIFRNSMQKEADNYCIIEGSHKKK